MIRVREYDPSLDFGRVIVMAEAMHRESPMYRDKPFVRPKVANLLDHAAQAANWLPLIAETHDGELAGFALVTVEADFFCEELQLLDLAIYVTPTRRGHASFPKLMERVEDWARERGASEANLGITTGVNHDAALRSFVKLGYIPTGTRVSKAL